LRPESPQYAFRYSDFNAVMIRSHLILLLPGAALLLSGCATQENKVLRGVETENLERLHRKYGTTGVLQNEIEKAENDPSGAYRNALLNDLILLVDLNYYHWEKLAYDKKAYADFGSAVAATTLSSISAIYKVEEVKTILSAMSSGITSTGVSFNSKVLQDQSLTAVFAKMRANRSAQLLKLQASMIKIDSTNKPIGPNPLSLYSVTEGLIDIAKYYNAGTFVAALQDIIETAAVQKTNSDTQSNNLKPNAALVNEATTTTHPQKLTTVVVREKVQPGPSPKPKDIQQVLATCGQILKSLSNDQAQKALTELKPNSPVSTNPREDISAMLIDTTTKEQADRILTVLQRAKADRSEN
jgi:hypothetical protein